MRTTEVRLVSRPKAAMTRENIEIVNQDLPDIDNGELLVKNLYMSVDPYMLGRMQGSVTYDTPFALGETMVGEAVGEVLVSNHPEFAVGDYVRHFLGWRDIAVCNGAESRSIAKFEGVSLDAHLDILSWTTGLAAYAGLFDIAGLQRGESVFVTAAAGAVGAAVCQMALAEGCHVVGSAGSADKVRWLENDLGIHKALNYKDYSTVEAVEQALLQAFPAGIDVMFENVGGVQLEAALSQMNNHGRIALCGMIKYYEQDYNNDRSVNTGPRNFIQIAERWLKVQGFSAPHYEDRMDEFERRVGNWIRQGKIESHTTIVRGLENTVEAMNSIMSGQNTGKMLVEI